MTDARFSNGHDSAVIAPYWWEDAPRPDMPPPPLPDSADVVIIGSGYAGLHAAIETARAGRRTVVLDKGVLGFGCSSRNGGQVSTSLKPSFKALSFFYGKDRALAMLLEGHRALDYIGDFVERESLDCAFHRCGRFCAAHSRGAYHSLARSIDSHPKSLPPLDAVMVEKSDQYETALGSESYFGGAIFPYHASLHPGAYHLGLCALAESAGAALIGQCRALHIDDESVGGVGGDGSGRRFCVVTDRGKIYARDVFIATNGYTGSFSPWYGRRLISIGSQIIATEALPEGLGSRLIPSGRVVNDTKRLLSYFRLSPILGDSSSGVHLLFGGRVSHRDERISAMRLREKMLSIFPDLSSFRMTHSWVGFVAYSFDTLPHMGCYKGIYYAGGYCGSGISLSSYFGMLTGRRILGLRDGKTVFTDLSFPTVPFYSGRAWFVPLISSYYGLRDRLDF